MSGSVFLSAAEEIGGRIADAAQWSGSACTWKVVRPDRGSPDFVRPAWERAGGALYEGTSGIALFLVELYRRTGEDRFASAAEGALRFAMEDVEAASGRAGFHDGTAGIAYAAARLYEVLGDPAWRDAAARLAERSVPSSSSRVVDVIGGGAGVIPALLSLSGVLDAGRMLELARAHGDHLLATSVVDVYGWSWPQPGNPRALLGMAHGNAGMAVGLLELHCATGDARYRYGGEKAFSCEAAAFDAARGNWPDLREPELLRYVQDGRVEELRERLRSGWRPAPPFMVAWCHGAPGIGLARLRAWELLGRDEDLRDARIAIGTTRRALGAGWEVDGWNFSLCHGAAGNCELLLQAARVLNEPELRAQAEQVGRDGCAQFGATGIPWPCGTLRALSDPGLMLGESGIGTFLLRLDGADFDSPTLLTPRHIPAQGSREGYDLLAQRDAHVAFGQTLRVMGRLGLAAPSALAEGALQSGHRELRRQIDELPDPLAQAWMDDAFAVEEERLRLAELALWWGQLLVEELTAPAAESVSWEVAVYRTRSSVRVVQTRWDWDAWLREGAGTLPPPEMPQFHLLRVGQDGIIRRSPTQTLAALLLISLEQPGSLDDAVARIAGELGSDAAALRAPVARQLRAAYTAGFVRLEEPLAYGRARR